MALSAHRLHFLSTYLQSELLPVYACGIAPEHKNAAARGLHKNTEGVGVDRCRAVSGQEVYAQSTRCRSALGPGTWRRQDRVRRDRRREEAGTRDRGNRRSVFPADGARLLAPVDAVRSGVQCRYPSGGREDGPNRGTNDCTGGWYEDDRIRRRIALHKQLNPTHDSGWIP